MEYLIRDFKKRIAELEEQGQKFEEEIKTKNYNEEEQKVLNKKINEIEVIIKRAQQKIVDLRDDMLNNLLS
ncbi:hypothetical protein [Flavobacterium sp. MMS24-S5]|uniref:hypothetical protein n=1 Tax=Flavobacterium sp. MMS24-S5 TaxID=3416605 RepID=UPI003CFEFC69